MTQPVTLMCAATAAATAFAAFTAHGDREIRVTASSPSAKSMNNNDMAISENSNCKSAEEAFAPRFDGLRFIETLVTAHR